MVERTQRLNVAFALSSVGLLLAMAAMVFFDYDREWKRYQAEFTRLGGDQTRAQLESAASGVDATKLQQLQAQLEAGPPAGGRQRRGDPPGERRDREARQRVVTRRIRTTASPRRASTWPATSTTRPFTRGLGSREARRRHLEELETEWARLRTALEDVLARRDAATLAWRKLQKTKLEAERARKELLAEQTRLQERLDDLKRAWSTACATCRSSTSSTRR